ncbi:hypothetical protein Acr_03g0019730 [Actinidia rufa]|uniref:At4g15545-like C-terminal domain-containing protein n=1 Tax=Actinidia rufa TaxID=165716 RepID=A0A7J0EH11_9ERIC|nr:hypothetical protein Acr_03g0019730 [Actinidia rufa]
MLAQVSAVPIFDLPDELLEVLPLDPFEQLDVARKITSIALSTRVSALESEASVLRHTLTDRDNVIADLQAQIESLGASLSETADKLGHADQEKESLMRENAVLSNTVKKLNRDVSKGGAPKVVATPVSSHASFSSQSLVGEDDATLPPSRTSPLRSQFFGIQRPRVAQGLLFASQTTTPRFTPPGSPPSVSALVSPTRTSKPASPRRHSISFATTRGMLHDRSSGFSSAPSSQHSSMSSLDAGSQSGRTRVDGKEFFRQVSKCQGIEFPQANKRGILCLPFPATILLLSTPLAINVSSINAYDYEQFQETLRKADEIFGPDNKDLYTIFEGLITRNIH